MSDWCSCDALKEAQEKATKWDAIVRCGECRWHKHIEENMTYSSQNDGVTEWCT